MNIKGNACIQMINYLKESYPTAQIDKLKMGLDDQARTLIERRILASSWVDHEHYMKILLAADRILGKSDLELVSMAGAKNVKSSHTKCMARGDEHCLFEFTWE